MAVATQTRARNLKRKATLHDFAHAERYNFVFDDFEAIVDALEVLVAAAPVGAARSLTLSIPGDSEPVKVPRDEFFRCLREDDPLGFTIAVYETPDGGAQRLMFALYVRVGRRGYIAVLPTGKGRRASKEWPFTDRTYMRIRRRISDVLWSARSHWYDIAGLVLYATVLGTVLVSTAAPRLRAVGWFMVPLLAAWMYREWYSSTPGVTLVGSRRRPSPSEGGWFRRNRDNLIISSFFFALGTALTLILQ